jgi:hypothetical protein
MSKATCSCNCYSRLTPYHAIREWLYARAVSDYSQRSESAPAVSGSHRP